MASCAEAAADLGIGHPVPVSARFLLPSASNPSPVADVGKEVGRMPMASSSRLANQSGTARPLGSGRVARMPACKSATIALLQALSRAPWIR